MEKLFLRKIDRISNYCINLASFARTREAGNGWKVEKYIFYKKKFVNIMKYRIIIKFN